MREEKPNILLIMTDQQRGDCLSAEGHPALLTPNMDSIAGRGVRFSRCYSTCPVCIPARRSLLSGQFPSTHGIVGYYPKAEWDASLSLPSALKAAGYHTYLAGRSMHQYPDRKRYGYDHMVVHEDYMRWLARQTPDDSFQPGGDYYATGVMHNDWTARPWPMDESLHLTNWTVNEALRFLHTRDPSCPFFLTVSFLAPHPPLLPPAFYMERYLRQELPGPVYGDWSEAPPNGGVGMDVSASRVRLQGEALRSCQAAYYGMINHIDDQIRRLLNPVNGIDWSNTVVLFTSDHGEMLGDHYLFRKSLPYEGSARVPLLIAAPDRFGLKRGRVVDKPAALEDIMPTILDLAGVPIPDTVEGRSLLPLMRGEEDSPWREYVHLEHGSGIGNPMYHALTDGKEKYIWFTQSGREQLFHLAEDPQELRNVADDPAWAERLQRWRSRLTAHLQGRPEGFSDGSRLIPGRAYPNFMFSN